MGRFRSVSFIFLLYLSHALGYDYTQFDPDLDLPPPPSTYLEAGATWGPQYEQAQNPYTASRPAYAPMQEYKPRFKEEEVPYAGGQLIPLRGDSANGADITNFQPEASVPDAQGVPEAVGVAPEDLPNAESGPEQEMQEKAAETQILAIANHVPAAPPSPSLVPDEDVNTPDKFQAPVYNEPNKANKRVEDALDALKSTLVNTGKEYTREKEWADMVQRMVEEYNTKLQNVHGHMDKLRGDMKAMLHKKKQIENMDAQLKVKESLEVAKVDLGALDEALESTKAQSQTFNTKRAELQALVGRLEGQLDSLRGGDEVEEAAVELEVEGDGGKHKKGFNKTPAVNRVQLEMRGDSKKKGERVSKN